MSNFCRDKARQINSKAISILLFAIFLYLPSSYASTEIPTAGEVMEQLNKNPLSVFCQSQSRGEEATDKLGELISSPGLSKVTANTTPWVRRGRPFELRIPLAANNGPWLLRAYINSLSKEKGAKPISLTYYPWMEQTVFRGLVVSLILDDNLQSQISAPISHSGADTVAVTIIACPEDGRVFTIDSMVPIYGGPTPTQYSPKVSTRGFVAYAEIATVGFWTPVVLGVLVSLAVYILAMRCGYVLNSRDPSKPKADRKWNFLPFRGEDGRLSLGLLQVLVFTMIVAGLCAHGLASTGSLADVPAGAGVLLGIVGVGAAAGRVAIRARDYLMPSDVQYLRDRGWLGPMRHAPSFWDLVTVDGQLAWDRVQALVFGTLIAIAMLWPMGRYLGALNGIEGLLGILVASQGVYVAGKLLPRGGLIASQTQGAAPVLPSASASPDYEKMRQAVATFRLQEEQILDAFMLVDTTFNSTDSTERVKYMNKENQNGVLFMNAAAQNTILKEYLGNCRVLNDFIILILNDNKRRLGIFGLKF